MPFINIRIRKEGATTRQKSKLIEGATKLLLEALGTNPQTRFVVVEKVATDNWFIGGGITMRRKQG